MRQINILADYIRGMGRAFHELQRASEEFGKRLIMPPYELWLYANRSHYKTNRRAVRKRQIEKVRRCLYGSRCKVPAR